MKFVDEFRRGDFVHSLASAISRVTTRPWILMEVCGGQTHTIVKYGLQSLLPDKLKLIHGPGCPVCVTPIAWIDKAVDIALNQKAILCSFGDMIRVPGSQMSLMQAKARGAEVKVVYSPQDALSLATQFKDREIVFFAVGFETTAPATAILARMAQENQLRNLSLLVSHVLVPPAMESILSSSTNTIQGFLAPGHVCSVMGYEAYENLSNKFRIPMVVTGFEPADILEGVFHLTSLLEAGLIKVHNQYSRAVEQTGNRLAKKLVQEVYEVIDQEWRGLGKIPQSGLKLRSSYDAFSAERKFGSVHTGENAAPSVCISGKILRGEVTPLDCDQFGTRCTPETPLGAPMVSSEGACAAYFKYKRERRN